jgi:hypothetical protein
MKQTTKLTDKEVVAYYGQLWWNVSHMKHFIKTLHERYEKEAAN